MEQFQEESPIWHPGKYLLHRALVDAFSIDGMRVRTLTHIETYPFFESEQEVVEITDRIIYRLLAV